LAVIAGLEITFILELVLRGMGRIPMPRYPIILGVRLRGDRVGPATSGIGANAKSCDVGDAAAVDASSDVRRTSRDWCC
jgi:hypothetical protein